MLGWTHFALTRDHYQYILPWKKFFEPMDIYNSRNNTWSEVPSNIQAFILEAQNNQEDINKN